MVGCFQPDEESTYNAHLILFLDLLSLDYNGWDGPGIRPGDMDFTISFYQ